MKKIVLLMILVVLLAVVLYVKNNEAAVVSVAIGHPTSLPAVSCKSCSKAHVVKPISTSPCPNGVYCNNPNTNCGEFCCPWGYFYSNPCTCRCYRSSDDAGADCSSYFRCQ